MVAIEQVDSIDGQPGSHFIMNIAVVRIILRVGLVVVSSLAFIVVVVLTTHEVPHTHLTGNGGIWYLRKGCTVWLHLFDHGEIIWPLHSIGYNCVRWVNRGFFGDSHTDWLLIYACRRSQWDWLLISFISLSVVLHIKTVPSRLVNALSLCLTGLFMLCYGSIVLMILGHLLHVALQCLVLMRVVIWIRQSVVCVRLSCRSWSPVLLFPLLLKKQVPRRAQLICVSIEVVFLRTTGVLLWLIIMLSFNEFTRVCRYHLDLLLLEILMRIFSLL